MIKVQRSFFVKKEDFFCERRHLAKLPQKDRRKFNVSGCVHSTFQCVFNLTLIKLIKLLFVEEDTQIATQRLKFPNIRYKIAFNL